MNVSTYGGRFLAPKIQDYLITLNPAKLHITSANLAFSNIFFQLTQRYVAKGT